MYKVMKVPNKMCYKVMKGSVVAAKCTTLAKAKAQVKLLNMLDHRMKINKK